MIRIGILVIDVSETRHAGIGGDGATRGGARTALTPAAVRPAPVYGSQLQDAGIAGHAAEGHVELSYRPVPVRLADGQTVTLRKPRVRVGNLAYGPMARAVRLSPRIAPAMIGLGLLEQIGATDIVTASDPFDQDGDGISGRPRWLTTANGGRRLGRFGWKAGAADLRTQAAAASSLDIGLSTHLFPAGSGDCTAAQLACQRAPDGGEPATGEPEISDKILGLVTFYSRHLAVPLRRHATDPAVLAGKAIFHTSGCAACHRPHFVTQGQLGESALAGQPIWPYSDLLLHDMGPDLADGLAEGDASGQEWRTPPLWGLGLAQTVNPRAGFLHDGRARTVLEAILWHGGEATAARTAVTALSAPDREHLLAYLTSL